MILTLHPSYGLHLQQLELIQRFASFRYLFLLQQGRLWAAGHPSSTAVTCPGDPAVTMPPPEDRFSLGLLTLVEFLSAGGAQPSWYAMAPCQCAFVWLLSYLRKVETAFVLLSPVRGIYSLPLTRAAKRAGSWTSLPGGAATGCGPCSSFSLPLLLASEGGGLAVGTLHLFSSSSCLVLARCGRKGTRHLLAQHLVWAWKRLIMLFSACDHCVLNRQESCRALAWSIGRKEGFCRFREQISPPDSGLPRCQCWGHSCAPHLSTGGGRACGEGFGLCAFHLSGSCLFQNPSCLPPCTHGLLQRPGQVAVPEPCQQPWQRDAP